MHHPEFTIVRRPAQSGDGRRYASTLMTAKTTTAMIVHGTGALMRPLEDFAEDLQDRFPTAIRVIEHHESSDGWTWQIQCTLLHHDAETLSEITDYLQTNFPTDVGGDLEIDSVTTPLFPPVPGIFFVLNASDSESSKVDVQLVDRFGRTRKSTTFDVNETQNTIDGIRIPQVVLNAGLRQAAGTGDFVDVSGVQVSPNDFEKFWAAAKEA